MSSTEAVAKRRRVAIIGAGPSGLSLLHAFSCAKRKLEEEARALGIDIAAISASVDKSADAPSKASATVAESDPAKAACMKKLSEFPEIVCFERQGDWGGQWLYSWRTGVDEYGEPVHSGMYSGLFSNGPKEALEYADYSFHEHFGRTIGSYPPRAVLADYILGRAKKDDVRDQIQFHHAVRWVEQVGASGARAADDEKDGESRDGFIVNVENVVEKQTRVERFHHVIVATGHFHTPHVPEFDGIESYTGKVMHAHDFRKAEMFTDQRVLIIGASYSAEDIALQCAKFGAKKVTATYRTKAMGYDWPEMMDERALLTEFAGGKLVKFKDGSSDEYDAVIMCTGYKHYFPFLPTSLRLETVNRLYADGLYKGTVWEKTLPKEEHFSKGALFYAGMQDQWFTFTMFDAEAWYIRDVILGVTPLAARKDRVADMDLWDKREKSLTKASEGIDYQADYVIDLLKGRDYAPYDAAKAAVELKIWKEAKAEGILTYRDTVHTSIVTGHKQSRHHTTWWEAKDDSLACYLDDADVREE